MRLVLLSDTHNRHGALAPLPGGDVLVHAGDLTGRGTLAEIAAFLAWFAEQPFRHKIVIAGNHDFAFERQAEEAEALIPDGVTYLRDSGAVIEGVKFWGSPWQPWFHDWAFNLERGVPLAERWGLIPDDVHVLVTHGPPHGILDTVVGGAGQHVGCEALRARLPSLSALTVHVFGHIHEAYGEVRGINELPQCRFVNACICDVRYDAVNRPVLVEV